MRRVKTVDEIIRESGHPLRAMLNLLQEIAKMDITARCKFRVGEVVPNMGESGNTIDEKIRMHTQYDETNPEDKAFSDATPSGELQMTISNPRLFGVFKPGETYYVNLEPADEPQPA